MSTQTSAEQSLLRRDAAHFFHQEGSSPCLSALRAVSGIWLETEDGRRLMDLHGNTVHHLGHAHPRIVAALKAQLDTLPFCPRRYTNETAVRLAENLTSRWPGGPAKALFATGGSDAIEIALKLARIATGRHETLSFEGSYHGHGFGAFGLSRAEPDPRLGPHLPGRRHVTGYWDARAGGAERALEDMRAAFADTREGIAAVVAEPIRSSCHVPPDWFWPEVRALCDRHGTLLVFDEIPSGLGKTGRFFAFEHFGVAPDAVVLGKALGGGMLPIAAVIADARLDIAPELAIGHYTHEKNPLTTRAALTVLELIDELGLIRRAAEIGVRTLAAMDELAARNPAVRGGRGLGAHLVLVMAGDEAAAQSRAAEVARACLDFGVSTTSKRDGVGFSLPLISTDEEIVEALSRIESTIAVVRPR